LARIVTSASAGVPPRVMGYGPIPATKKALQRAGLQMKDIGLVELNEAFAVQSLAVMEDLELDPEIVNVNGGAIAIGHPLGCSGARLMTTLVHELRLRGDVKYGLVTLCVGVGQGEATIIEWLGEIISIASEQPQNLYRHIMRKEHHMRYRFLLFFLLVSLSACSFDVEVITPAASVPESGTATPPSAFTLPPDTSTTSTSFPGSALLTETPPAFPAFTTTPLPRNLGTFPIRFDPNGTYVDITDTILAGTSKTYSISASKGQVMS